MVPARLDCQSVFIFTGKWLEQLFNLNIPLSHIQKTCCLHMTTYTFTPLPLYTFLWPTNQFLISTAVYTSSTAAHISLTGNTNLLGVQHSRSLLKLQLQTGVRYVTMTPSIPGQLPMLCNGCPSSVAVRKHSTELSTPLRFLYLRLDVSDFLRAFLV